MQSLFDKDRDPGHLPDSAVDCAMTDEWQNRVTSSASPILPSMIRSVVFLIVCVFSCAALAQSHSTEGPSPYEPTIFKLPPPAYPPMALAAHVSGNVELELAIGRDGALQSAAVASGPSMLRQAALAAAKATQFACVGCIENTNQLRVTYRFELGETVYCSSPDASYPRVAQSKNTITLTDRPTGTCDPAATIEKVQARSMKCLYLWKCGWR